MIEVLGKDVLLYVFRTISGSSVPVLTVCATNLTRRRTAATVSLLTRGAGKSRIYKSTIKDESLTLEGLITMDTNFQEFEDWDEGSQHHVIIIYRNSAGDQLSYEGDIVVTGIDDNNGASDFSTYSISMVRSGEWTKLKTFNNVLMDGDGNPIYDGDGSAIRVP